MPVTAFTLFFAVTFAVAPLPPAATQPATSPASQPAPAPTPAVLHWLDRIQQRAESIKTIHANVRYDRVQGLLGDTQRRWGSLVYQAAHRGNPDMPAEFAVHFDRLAVDQAARPQNRWYIYDGHWLAEKYDDQRIFIRTELTPPQTQQTPSKQQDLLSLGHGPFVLPLDARKAQVLKEFNVKLVPPTQDQPKALKDTIHLELTPKKTADLHLTRIDLWYDRKTLLPRRATTHDESQNTSIITLTHIMLDKPIEKGVFSTQPPQGPGWQVQIKRYQAK